MTVQELEDLLAKLPADMPVFIMGGGPLYHIGLVEKQNKATLRFLHGGHERPPCVRLEAGNPGSLWYEPEPEVIVKGRWPISKAKRTDGGS